MVTHVFDDEIVSATKFRDRQSHWLAIASKRPVTITSGDNQVTVFSRERVHELYRGKYYLELAVKFYNEKQTGEIGGIFPWAEYLDNKEKKQFGQEFINAILLAVGIDKWDTVEELLDDWKATAEAKQDSEFVEEFRKKIPKDKYILLK